MRKVQVERVQLRAEDDDGQLVLQVDLVGGSVEVSHSAIGSVGAVALGADEVGGLQQQVRAAVQGTATAAARKALREREEAQAGEGD